MRKILYPDTFFLLFYRSVGFFRTLTKNIYMDFYIYIYIYIEVHPSESLHLCIAIRLQGIDCS